MDQILDLTAQLPNLKFLTIQLPGSPQSVDETHRIVDVMALRGIEVTVKRKD
jgi:hypothetical protein